MMEEDNAPLLRVEGVVVPNSIINGEMDNLEDELFKAVRYGFKDHVEKILKTNKDIINSLDNDGYSCAHWASKKGYHEILSLLYQNGADLSIVSSCEAKMRPIHWAASEGKLSTLNFLIGATQDINALDDSGCSPIIIATQYNQINAVIFLIRNGCDPSIRDVNGDTCLHWAAYKGLVELTAYLTQTIPQELNTPDLFGQTPVHLATLKNHYECVEYLIVDCQADIKVRDKNGSTPLDLSISKGNHKIEWFLRRRICRSYFQLIKTIGFVNITKLKYFPKLIFGGNETEYSYWAWRVVFISNFFGSLITLYIALNEKFSDLYILHESNVIIQFFWWIMFFMCLFKSPGLVYDNHSEGNIYSYEKGLEEIATFGNNVDELPNLCHTCRVRRPLRSKHCKILRHCIHKFDHFCPFVGNTVGRDNYKYFFGVILIHFICSIFWFITVGYIIKRMTISWLFILYIFYTIGWFLMIAGLLRYHIQLTSLNMTTNEYINIAKYTYLRDNFGGYDNPFNRGSTIKNIFASLFSTEVVYFKGQIKKYY